MRDQMPMAGLSAAIRRQRAQGFDAVGIASRLGLAVPLVRQVLDAPHRRKPAP